MREGRGGREGLMVFTAHRNGVLSLGTIITEWKEGFVLCSKVFSNETMVEEVVDKLIQLAVYYNFDGWLINIENNIQVSYIILIIINITVNSQVI